MARLRLDGYVSLMPYDDLTVGVVTTKTLTFTGSKLFVNAVVDGSLTAELLDAAGKPIAGFGQADCKLITGDRLDHVVTWKRGPSVTGLAGKPIKVRFHLNRTHLYAFRFADAK